MSSTGVGFQVPYPAITLHAIARPESGPSIYCQLDELTGEPGAAESPENDEASDMRELSIIPSNPASRKFSEIESRHTHTDNSHLISGADI